MESARCLYCYDAPCIRACPTSIDIPKFIHQIRTDNLKGSAITILSSNIMGGTCARVCPTEELCEGECVKNAAGEEPILIGRLQRYAVDAFLESGRPHPFPRGESSGRRIAVIGGGPAGLACAHRSAMYGHEVTVFESRPKSGGLNEYGLAAYKMADDFAAREVNFLLEIGGISIEHDRSLGVNLNLDDLKREFDAVFIAVGLGGVNDLNIPGEDLPGVRNAIDFIEELRQTVPKSDFKVGNKVVVIGGGNTAIDAAVQSKRLGAESVTLVYRRGEAQMPATEWEQDLAKTNDVVVRCWSKPVEIRGTSSVETIVFEKTQLDNGRLKGTGHTWEIPADMVFKAIGQTLYEGSIAGLKPESGKIVVDDSYRTGIPGVFAGGDCIAAGADLTVQAVDDGAKAAAAIDCLAQGGEIMADLHCRIAGIDSINPFWLASAPPTDKKINVVRAFEAGWGGVVWKTLGPDPPVINVTSRYGVLHDAQRGILGINNIELITDRPLETNLREIREVRSEWPDRVIIGSMMAPMMEKAWKELAVEIAEAGVHGIELNLGCPHGMCERGDGLGHRAGSADG